MQLVFEIEEEDIGPFGIDYAVMYKGIRVGDLFLDRDYSRIKLKKMIVE